MMRLLNVGSVLVCLDQLLYHDDVAIEPLADPGHEPRNSYSNDRTIVLQTWHLEAELLLGLCSRASWSKTGAAVTAAGTLLPLLPVERPRGSLSRPPSDVTPKDSHSSVKSAPYRDARYKAILETKGSFMDKSELGLADESKSLCHDLLAKEQTVPEDSLFRDDIFEATCRRVKDRNEARVLRDISPLIVPPAEVLAIHGVAGLDCLVESVNEGWNNSISVASTRPQPDYCLGFRREAFTSDQLDKLLPFVGEWAGGDVSYFLATYYMFFPFLTCEVKGGAAALDVADRQNAHSMTIAVRAVVELFRLVGREHELHCQILGFSVSHDNSSVRIYGHYPIIDGKVTKYYRHPIRTFDITDLDGREKWTAYKFSKNVYTTWVPKHFERIRSAVDQLSAHNSGLPPPSQKSGLSQEVESCQLYGDDESGVAEPPDTPDTCFTENGGLKKRRMAAADG